ncbi:MAG TPA: DUF6263 family protein [Verrucomicrobiae bacterium]|jgi:hypothetical protein
MKMPSLLRTALPIVCVVLSFTACKKSNDASAQKESKEPKITGHSSDPAVSLKPTWPVGKRYVMRMESDQSTEMPNMQPARDGQPPKATMRIGNKFAQEYALVATNAADGNRGLEMEILAIELESGAGNQMMTYHSRNNKIAPAGGAMGEALDQLIGGKIRYLLTPENKVLQVEGLDELIQGMEMPAAGKPGGRGRGAATTMARGIFNEDVLKQIIEFAGMPTHSVRVGDTWTDAREVKVPTLGALALTTTNTLRGWQEHDGRKCARVDFTGAMGSKTGDTTNAIGIQMQMQGGTVVGQYWFAPEVGFATDTEVNQDYQIRMSGVPQAGRNADNTFKDMNVSVHQHVTVKLLEITPP